jgi:hydroxymethylglutaryl-CoA reductase
MGSVSSSAARLAGVMAAVGLAQNTGALKAMVTDGIQHGHMRLHARQIALAAGADAAEVAAVAEVIVAEHNVKESRAREVLAALRAGATP